MRLLVLLFFSMVIVGCSKKEPLLGDTPFQKKMNADFKDASKSPLKSKDLKGFKALDFFKYNEAYKVSAGLNRTPDSEWFMMKTTTERVSKERVYGVVSFEIAGEQYQLNVYQSEEDLNTPGNEDFLFLPFLDLTNGDSTYGGGRYINLSIPSGDTIEIDFNEAYNPYCVYNEKYSCPIVPRENFLNLKVQAGLKKFRKGE